MIDVQQRPLRALQQHRGAALDGAMHAQPHVFGNRQQARRQPRQHPHRVLDRRALGGVHALELRHSHARRPRPRAHATGRDSAGRARARRGARPCPRTPCRCRDRSCRSPCWRRSPCRAACGTASPDARARSRTGDLRRRCRRRPACRSRRTAFSGSSTTPLPIAQRTPGCMMPLGNLVQHEGLVADVHGVSGVGAALVAHHPVGASRPARPPACPCPSSPHCAPTTTIVRVVVSNMRIPESVQPVHRPRTKNAPRAVRGALRKSRNCTACRATGIRPRWTWRRSDRCRPSSDPDSAGAAVANHQHRHQSAPARSLPPPPPLGPPAPRSPPASDRFAGRGAPSYSPMNAPTKAPTNAPASEPTTGTGTPTIAPIRPPRIAPHEARRRPAVLPGVAPGDGELEHLGEDHE